MMAFAGNGSGGGTKYPRTYQAGNNNAILLQLLGMEAVGGAIHPFRPPI